MPRQRTVYEEHDDPVDGGNAIDREVVRRLGRSHQARRRAIVRLHRRIAGALGPHTKLFLRLEELVNARARAETEAYFEVGFARGVVEGRTQAAASSRRLVRSLQEAARGAGSTVAQRVSALLTAALGLLDAPR